MTPPQEKARYVGEGGNVLADGTVLIPGETIALVPRSEAETSDLWEPIDSGRTSSPNPRNAAPDGTPPGPPVPEPEAA